ncbi:group II intron reverse transcriptase/maturase [Pedobacter sp.]|uniref:group II intron reverse transcriptase/maturase n=1 Tax=Pedobacter sp. TaxID=1411316 RepID=UPI002D0CEF8C|nr:group II intron reverse transcriptase/maturase [Pedobacter sp.]HWW42473.1 group II intron reverse transcriptase/maturase [Pedobacter sp.]
MTAKATLAGAAPTQLKWTGLNWPKHEAVVKKLQIRIAKAVRENRYGKVKSLQRLLTTSFSAKILAVRKVTQNKGKSTPGVDGKTASSPKQKMEIVSLLKRRDYRPKPLRRIYIKKKNGKQRPLSIPTILDRCQQQLHYQSLIPISETTSDNTSYGFRPERSCADAIEQTFQNLCRGNSANWIMEGDIKGCFDNISHEWMLENICMDKTILKKWLKAGYIETKKLFPTLKGTPQGSIISPCLSNFVLNGIEKLLDDNFGKLRLGINLVRYADDFIITGRKMETLERIKVLIIEFLKERGLELSLEKTKVTHIHDGFDFLGQNIRKYKNGKRYKLLIKPSKDNVKTFLKKLREGIRQSGALSQKELIAYLNPIIRGWTTYHRSVVSKETFHKIDHEIWKSLWKWAKRRHPKKGSHWVMQKYFTRIELRNYCFRTKEKLKSGATTERYLFKASDMKIIRHLKIKNKANIFDSQYEEYFEWRHSCKMTHSKTGRLTLELLLKRQSNKCICCGGALYTTNKGIVHLLTSRLKGGDYKISNLCIMHFGCHRRGFEYGFVYQLPTTSTIRS